MVKTIGTWRVKISPVTYKKKLKEAAKEYNYGSVSLKNSELAEYIGKEVDVRVILPDKKKGAPK